MSLQQVRDLCAAAAACHAEGRTGAGLPLARQAVDLCRSTLGEGHYALPLSLCSLGWLLDAGGEEATPSFTEALVRARRLADWDFEHARAAFVHVRDWRKVHGDGPGALALQEELVTMHAASLGDDHPRYFAAKAELGTMAGR